MLVAVKDGTLLLTPDLPLVAVNEDELHADFAEAVAADGRGCATVVLDLARVREIDSRGVSVIVELHRLCRREGHAFCVIGVTAHVRRVLDLFQLSTLFPVEFDAASAR